MQRWAQKNRNGTDITETEDIKKRWQEYTEKLYKKDLHNLDDHEGVISPTHVEPDILECEVRCCLGSITMNKASGGDEIPVELFQTLKDDAYSAIKKNAFESVLMRWMKLEPIIQSEVSQKEKHQYSILMHIYGI